MFFLFPTRKIFLWKEYIKEKKTMLLHDAVAYFLQHKINNNLTNHTIYCYQRVLKDLTQYFTDEFDISKFNTLNLEQFLETLYPHWVTFNKKKAT